MVTIVCHHAHIQHPVTPVTTRNTRPLRIHNFATSVTIELYNALIYFIVLGTAGTKEPVQAAAD